VAVTLPANSIAEGSYFIQTCSKAELQAEINIFATPRFL
jgi:hypothetical protein